MKQKLFPSFVLAVLMAVVICSSTPAQSRRESDVFDLVNQERSRAHLGRLSWDDELADVARGYSRRMAQEGFFDHYDPNGKTVIDRAARLRHWSTIGENLFVCEPHSDFAQTAIHGWMNSKTHRTNMLDGAWTATGIGIATAGDGSIFITQVFTR
ncbi:MAG TPA: CAP domain-containing protein [Pyrinomonadaceae bacterium]|nr:CAP domain-containing protein [Pyrinomonadaceae bacterium]